MGQDLFKGPWLGIYLNEVKRTDGTPESLEYVKLNTRVRYGNYDQAALEKLKELTASEEEFLDERNEFASATHLTAYHFHQEGRTDITTADSSNARSLVLEAQRRNKPIMIFKATHSPDSEVASLEQESAKYFRNMPSNLYLIEGAPVIITCNINPSLSLYNGAMGEFIGPIYIQKTYEITDYEIFQSADLDQVTFRTTRQIQIKLNTGSSVTLPVGTPICEINNRVCTTDMFDNLTQASFQSAKVLSPRQPPFLPDYLVVKIDGYGDAGGPPFFPHHPQLRDYVCIPPFQRHKKTNQGEHIRFTRTQFPLELAYVMTAYKGIGATHKRTILKLKGKFHVPGLYLVGTTRVMNPKHCYIPPDQWPTVYDLQKQRLQSSVLQSENFERIVRSKSAQLMRKSRFYDTLPNFPFHIDKDVFNTIADLVHDQWLEMGNPAKNDAIVQEEIKKSVLESYAKLQNLNVDQIYEDTINFMKTTDEYMLLQKVPHLHYSVTDIEKSTRTDRPVRQKTNTNPPSKRPRKATPKVPQKLPSITVQREIRNTRSSKKPPECIAKMNTSNDVDITHVNNRPSTSTHSDSNLTIVPWALSEEIPLYRFENTEQNCYMNSTLQMLLSLNAHRLSVGNESALVLHTNEPNPSLECALQFNDITRNAPGSTINPMNLTNSFHSFYSFLHNSTRNDLNERGVQHDINAIIPVFIDNQHIFDRENFNILHCTVTTCLNCGNKSEHTEPAITLPIQVPRNDDNLQNIIDHHFQQETLLSGNNQYHCTNCQSYQNASQKQVCSDPLPLFLIVNLKRFDELDLINLTNFRNNSGVRLNDFSIVMPAVSERQERVLTKYRLQSAISHLGQTVHTENGERVRSSGGHYIAHVKHGNDWYNCNDKVIYKCAKTDISSKDIVYLAFKKDTTLSVPSEINSSLPLGNETEEMLPGPSNTKYCISKMPKVIPNFTGNSAIACKISLVQSDITKLKSDCIVNAANSELQIGGGVDGAIHNAAGPRLYHYCSTKYGKCGKGQAVISPSFDLEKNGIKYIIHTVGPKAGNDELKKSILTKCYQNSLDIVTTYPDIRTIAFPCIATEIYKFDNTKAAKIALKTAKEWLEVNHSQVDQIIFCTYKDVDHNIYKAHIKKYFPEYGLP